MQTVHFYWSCVWSIVFLLQVNAYEYVTLSHDGPVVLGGTITFRADLLQEYGQRPSGTFKYKWADNALIPHEYETPATSNTTTYWSISYPRENNIVGIYEVQVVVSKRLYQILWSVITSLRIKFHVTPSLNGDITIVQANKTLKNSYISSTSEAKMVIDMRKGDYDYIMEKATSVSTYWFIDCKCYGQTSDFTFPYNFTTPNEAHVVEALVVASYEPLTTVTPSTTTVVPSLTTSIAPSTSHVPNVTQYTNTTATLVATTTLPTTYKTMKPMTANTTLLIETGVNNNNNSMDIHNMSLPYICLNSSIVPLDPNKTYGHFVKNIDVRAPIMNISVEGTDWIQPWDMLSLNVTCRGSGPFNKCLQFYRGVYNVTGNETCDDAVPLHSCNFSIIHYFLEPSVYTILVILNNDVSTEIYPKTINIYKVTTKPQLSVIILPVSCSLAAVVLIVFGVAYYIQSRERFTIEVADFDFGQHNPEMEYKTFRERLRDSFNNAVRPGSKRISGYKPLSNPQTLQ